MLGSSRLRFAAATALLVAAAAVFLGVRPRPVVVRRVYRIGIRNSAAPGVRAIEGRMDALAVEVVSEAARRRKFRIEWKESPEGPDEALGKGRVDLWPLFAALPNRKGVAHITEPWIVGERCVLSTKPPPGDWRGLPVTYGLGSASLIETEVPGAVPIHAQGEIAAIQAMCRGEAAGAVVLIQSLGALILSRPEGCETAQFRITALQSAPLRMGIGSTFAAAEAADGLRREIDRMAQDGSLARMFGKYAVYSGAQSEVLRQLAEAEHRTRTLAYGSGGLVLAFAVLLWQMFRVRQARAAAVRANAAKSEFLANMSHEIRTPLNGVVGMAEALGHTELNDDQREMIGIIHQSSDSLMRIVNEILSFSHLESGTAEMDVTEFDLMETVQQVRRALHPQAMRKNLRFETAVAPGVPRRVRTDQAHLRQILLNLVSNAIKFTHGGEVRIEVMLGGDPAEKRALLFRVTDTGIGIASETVARLFTPFSQADSRATRNYGGTGLGLAIAARLVTVMSGSMGVDSQPGRGSTFWFMIPVEAVPEDPARMEEPRSAQALPEAAAPAVSGAPAMKGHVLIVDDNPINQMVAVRTVRGLGYAADVAPGAREALEAMRERRYDAVFMDCQMPDMDGYEASAEIRRMEARSTDGVHTPVIAMTANAIEGDRERCLAAGMDDYLPKPVRMAAVAKILDRWTGSGSRQPARLAPIDREPEQKVG